MKDEGGGRKAEGWRWTGDDYPLELRRRPPQNADPARPHHEAPLTHPPPAPEPAPGADLLKAVRMRMPFGKYAGRRLVDLPEEYLLWFSQQGFPRGELGRLLQLVYEIKLNGLEHLLTPLRE